MNLVFLVNKDIYANYALNLLLPHLKVHQIRIFCSSVVGSSSSRPKALQELAWWEQQWFNDHVCRSVDEKPLQPEKFRSWKGFNDYLMEPVSLLNHIHTEAGLREIQSVAPDLMISIRFGKILQPSVISIPKQGVINLHSGLLPQYRGVMATFWSMLNGEKQIGTSLHQITDDAIDKGILLSRTEQPLQENKSYLQNTLSLYQGGVAMILRAIELIEERGINGLVQQDIKQEKANYYSFPGSHEVNQFLANYSFVDRDWLIDWVMTHYGRHVEK